MDSRSEKTAETTEPAEKSVENPSPRPWVAPTFERLSLKEATAGLRNAGADLSCS